MNKESLIDWNLYKCYEDGRIYSKGFTKDRFLKGYVHPSGYVQVGLKCIDGKKRNFRWHRVIYIYFNGDIPEGMQINHIDENKQNNALSNLNLMTPKENANWGTRNERCAEKQRGISRPYVVEKFSKHVVAVDIDDNVVLEFPSINEARRNGYYHVDACCIGKRRTCGGYYWYFKDEWLAMQKQYASPHKREDAYQLEINFD